MNNFHRGTPHDCGPTLLFECDTSNTKFKDPYVPKKCSKGVEHPPMRPCHVIIALRGFPLCRHVQHSWLGLW